MKIKWKFLVEMLTVCQCEPWQISLHNWSRSGWCSTLGKLAKMSHSFPPDAALLQAGLFPRSKDQTGSSRTKSLQSSRLARFDREISPPAHGSQIENVHSLQDQQWTINLTSLGLKVRNLLVYWCFCVYLYIVHLTWKYRFTLVLLNLNSNLSKT